MSIKQKLLIFVSILFLVTIIVLLMTINDKYSSEPITEECKVNNTSIRKAKKGKQSLNIWAQNEYGNIKFSTKIVRNWQWNLSNISDSLIFEQAYSELDDSFYPKNLVDKKIVLDNTSSLLITYRIGFFRKKIFDDVICYYNN